jgi:hypothetical protein
MIIINRNNPTQDPGHLLDPIHYPIFYILTTTFPVIFYYARVTTQESKLSNEVCQKYET